MERVSRYLYGGLVACVCLVACPSTIRASGPGKALAQYASDVWTTKEGLPHNWVNAVAQTRDGYLWIGTAVGLARFDGVKFTLFNKTTNKELKANNITALLAGRDGSLWVGTLGGGLSRLKDNQFVSYTTHQGIAHNIVTSIIEDGEDGVWVGTGGGLSRYQAGRFTNYTTSDGLPGNKVQRLAKGTGGGLWLTTPEGNLCQFDEGKFITHDLRDVAPDGVVGNIYVDREGTLWAGTRSGLVKFKDGRFTIAVPEVFKGNTARALLEDREGSLWVAVSSAGILRLTGGEYGTFTGEHGLADDRVFSLCEDAEGSIWVGTHGGGLIRLKNGNFSNFNTEEGRAFKAVRAIFEDRAGHLWIGDGNNLRRFKDGRWTDYAIKKGLPKIKVRAITETRDGGLWFGTSAGNLFRFKDGAFAEFTASRAGFGGPVISLYGDQTGGLWIGTDGGGVRRLKDNHFTVYTTGDGLSSNNVRAIAEDGEGDIWVGTIDGGLNRIKDGKITAYATRDGLSSDAVQALYADREGNLWIGTNGGGLNRFREGRITSYTTGDGLFDDVTFTILEDGEGNLWMGSEKGVYRVSRRELDEYDQGKIKALTSSFYIEADGMRSSSVIADGNSVACQTRDGRLWFSTLMGVVVVDPKNIKRNALPPPVFIEQAAVNNRPVDPTGSARIPPGPGDLVFSYTALSYMIPQKIRFKYKLEGYDEEWVDAGPRREARYTNIPPGSYRFLVKASNNDGVWNETGASFGFRLLPHFYQTYWFYALCAASVAAVGWQVHRLRIKRVRAEHSAVLSERNRIAREIHDTLAQEVAGVLAQLQAVKFMLKASPQAAEKHLERARVLASTSLADARRMVLDLRHQALYDVDLPTALSNVVGQTTADSPLRVEFSVSGVARRLPDIYENNILRIGQEAVTNTVKHARAGRLRVELSYNHADVQLRVADDGCGFEPQSETRHDGGHFGLLGMRERAGQIGGRFSLHSKPGEGTIVTIKIDGGRGLTASR